MALLSMPYEAELMRPWINYYGDKSLQRYDVSSTQTVNNIADLHRTPDIMRLFAFFIKFGCNQDFRKNALLKRKPYGKDNWTELGAVPPNLASNSGTNGA